MKTLIVLSTETIPTGMFLIYFLSILIAVGFVWLLIMTMVKIFKKHTCEYCSINPAFEKNEDSKYICSTCNPEAMTIKGDKLRKIALVVLFSALTIIGVKGLCGLFSYAEPDRTCERQKGQITDNGGYCFDSWKFITSYSDGHVNSTQILLLDPDSTVNDTWMGHRRLSIMCSDWGIDGKLDLIRLSIYTNNTKKKITENDLSSAEVCMIRDRTTLQWTWEYQNHLIYPPKPLIKEFQHAIDLINNALTEMHEAKKII